MPTYRLPIVVHETILRVGQSSVVQRRLREVCRLVSKQAAVASVVFVDAGPFEVKVARTFTLDQSADF